MVPTKANEGHERWKSRLERLEEDCSEERKAAREGISHLLDIVEEAEAAARRALSAAEEEQEALRASLTAEYNQACWGAGGGQGRGKEGLGRMFPGMSTNCSGRRRFFRDDWEE